MKRYAGTLLQSFSYIVFVKNRWIGLCILVTSFINPSSCFHALIAYCSLLIMGRLMGMPKDLITNELFAYNSILVGLSLGYLFKISTLSVLFAVAASFFTMLLSFSLHGVFSYYLGLPILNLPFTITATLVYLSSIRYGNLFLTKSITLPFLNIPAAPLWLSGLLKSVGTIIFLPYDVVGILILCAMLVFSRINFFLIVLGYYTGTSMLALLKGSWYMAFADPYSFNFILIALALGGYFCIPCLKSYLIAFAGVMASVFVFDAINVVWSMFQIPVFTIPFAVVSLLILYVLVITKTPLLTVSFIGSPEHNLEHFSTYTSRFNILLPQPYLPFAGEWKVYQGFEGQWTHKGIWSKAVDFIIEDHASKKSFRNNGLALEDYYCYNKPVLSPVTGTVVAVCDETEDNPIGTVDQKNNWGNYVILHTDWRYYVEISHFAARSIAVKPGDRVTAGQILGRCGNSGYSPQPHIHMQCQYLEKVGSPTIPFSFSNCIADGKLLNRGAFLKADQAVKPLSHSRMLDRRLLFVLDDTFAYRCTRNGIKEKRMTLMVKMDDNGAYYLLDTEKLSRLYFSNKDGIFIFYKYEGSRASLMKYLFLALPSIPLTEELIAWNDELYPSLIQSPNPFFSFMQSFNAALFRGIGHYCITKNRTIHGTIKMKRLKGETSFDTVVSISENKGISSVSVAGNNQSIILELDETI